MTTDTTPDDEPYAIRTSGVFDPASGAHDRSVIIVEDGRVADLRDDVPNDVPLAVDHDGYAIPGLVDAHSHASIRPWEGDQLTQLGLDPATNAIRSATNLRADLEAGTTTMRLMAEEHYLDIHLAEMEQAGELFGPRLLPSGIHLTPTDGHGMVYSATDGVQQIRERIRENMSRGATHTKLFATGGVSSDTGSPGRSLYTREEIRAIVDETHRHEKHVAAHAHGGDGARLCIEEGVDTIEHASLFGETEIDMLEGSDQFVVGNFAISSHPNGIEAGDGDNPAIIEKLRESRAKRADVWELILSADLNVAIGTDSMHGYMYYEIEKLAELGASNARALDAGTLTAAQAIDRDEEVGSIEVGKRADVVLLADDPLENLSTIRDPVAVFKDGEQVV